MSRFRHSSRLTAFRFLTLLGLSLFAAAGVLAQPTADDPLAVTGTLVDERGTPVADAEVVLRPYPSTYELDLDLLGYDALPAAVDRMQSGLDGSFSLKAPVPGPYRLEIRTAPPAAHSDAVVPLVYGNLTPLEAPRILQANELPDRHLVAARVLDSEDRPIEGALVIASPTRTRSPRYEGRNSDQQPERLYPRFQPAAARTDAQGNARFLMPTANANITVAASGFAIETSKTEAGRASFVLAPDPGTRFRVRAPNGALAPGVLLRTGGKARAPLAITDEQGEVIAGAVAGASAEVAYELARWDNAFARVSADDIASARSSASDRIVGVRLVAPLRIPGRVVDRFSGDPVADAAIWVVGSPGENALSEPNGGFRLNSRPREESLRLWVQAGGYVSAEVTTTTAEYGAVGDVVVTLKPAAPLYGFVTDFAEQPVAGAELSALPRSDDSISNLLAFRPQNATSAADGSFRMPDIAYEVAYRLTIQAEGFASTGIDLPPYEPGAGASPVRIRLSAGRQARGRVVDTDENPVADAEVKLRWPEQKQTWLLSRLAADATEPVTTDEQGAFRIAAVPSGEYDVRVSHAEYVSADDLTVEVPEGGGEVDLGDFTLVAGAEILGLVVDPDQRPVEGALVRFREYGPDRDYERTAKTDADGSFTLAGLPHELVDLTVEAEGYSLFALRGARPATGETVLIQLVQGASVSGRVLTAAGTAAVGTGVHLKPDYQTRVRGRTYLSINTWTRTDADGRFRFGHVFPGTWSVEASAGTEAGRTDLFELASGSERTIELHLHAQDQLTVIVTASSGQPVTEARLRLEPADGAQSTDYGTTDATGRAQIQTAAGPATLSVEHPEHLDETREIVVGAGNTELTIQLQAGGEISGFVRSADGAPASATVEAHTEESLEETDVRMRRFLDSPATTTSGGDGFFRVTGLDEGRYFLVARAAGYPESSPAEPIDVDGRGVASVEIVLESGASLRGAVTGLEPADLAQVTVTATRQAQWQSATPDTEGNFTIENLAPGTWEVVARRGDSFTGRAVERSVTIAAAGAEEFIEVPFEAGLRLTGQVFAAGEPVAGAHVGAERLGHEDLRHAEVDQQGHFELDGLQAGSYRLGVQTTTFGGVEYRSVELQTDVDGLRIDLQPEAILSGIILDATTGLPLRDAKLVAGDAAAIAALARREDEQTIYRTGVIAGGMFSETGGRFEIGLGPKAEQLWVTHEGYQGALISLNIGPGQRQDGLVIQLQPAPSEPQDR